MHGLKHTSECCPFVQTKIFCWNIYSDIFRMTPLHVNTSDNKTNKIEKKLIETSFSTSQKEWSFLYFEQALLSHLYGTERRLKKINFLKFKIFPKKRTLIFLKRVLIFAHTFSSKSTTPNHKLMMENEILIG